MATNIKKNLAKHRLSHLMSILWSSVGYACFVLVVIPVLFKPMLALWQKNWTIAAPLYLGLALSFALVTFFMVSVRQFPYSNRYEVLISFSLAINASLLAILAGLRQFYSVRVICCFLVFQIIWLGLEILYRARFVEYCFAIFPASIKISSADFPEYRITLTDFTQEMERHGIDAVIVEDEKALDAEWTERLAQCRSMDIPVIPLAFFLENVWGRVPLDIIQEAPAGLAYSSWYMAAKTIIDKVLALVGILLLLPVFALIAAILKITSKEPALFKQERVGLNDRIFVIYKFRTMRGIPDAPADGGANGQQITLFGKWLRKYHLDELPQLFNVLWGDLTLVGPRPETPEWTKFYKSTIPLYGIRTRVNQGVVGWALIHQGNVSGTDATKIKVSYDIYYMKHASLFLDIYIILKSLWLMFFGIESVSSPHRLMQRSKK